MGLKLIVQKSGSYQEVIEFKELQLARVLSGLFNHHPSQNPNDRMSVAEAAQLIQTFEGQQQFFLHHVSNQHNSKRSLGVVIRGKWNDANFSAAEIQIEENNFKLGLIRKDYRTAGKFLNDTLPLVALLNSFKEQDDLLAGVGFIEEVEPIAQQALEAVATVREPTVALKSFRATGSPPPSSSKGFEEHSSELEEPSSPYDDPFGSKFVLNLEHFISNDEHSQSSESEENDLIKNGRKSLSEDATEFRQLNTNQYGFFDHLKWPTLTATLAYCTARALHAARLITSLAIGTTTAIWAGLGFVLAGVIQAIRESLKSSSYNSYSEGKDTDEGLQKNLPTLSPEAWQSFKDGVDAQKSIVNQFKSNFRPSNYIQAKPYYAGYYLSEHNPNFKLDDIEAKRKATI